MGLKSLAKRFIESRTNTRLFRDLPRGTDLFFDVREYLPHFDVRVVFDVGANVGQSATPFLEHFPECRVYCFEPAQDNFQKLRQRLGSHERVRCVQAALGRSAGQVRMILGRRGDRFRLAQGNGSAATDEVTTTVPIDSIDAYAASADVERIDFLKIDTEGHDLAVLEGARRMLSEGRVRMVQVEAGMNPENTLHVPLHRLQRFLEEHDYYLFAFYEQHHEWPTQQPHLRRTNPVFVSRELREQRHG